MDTLSDYVWWIVVESGEKWWKTPYYTVFFDKNNNIT
tara:strand:- start:85 stop:195 length:111 start_codon:yes stop_codon:yes gene_type:complete